MKDIVVTTLKLVDIKTVKLKNKKQNAHKRIVNQLTHGDSFFDSTKLPAKLLQKQTSIYSFFN